MKKNVTAGVPMLAISISHDPLRSFLRPVYFETEINAVYTGQRPVKNGDSARTRGFTYDHKTENHENVRLDRFKNA